MKELSISIMRLFLFSLYIIVISSIIISLLMHQEGIDMLSDVTQVRINGTVSIDGSMEKIPILTTPGDNYNFNLVNHSLVIEGNFDHSITDGMDLILWPRNLRMKLYVNDQLKISTNQREDFPEFIEYAGNSYQIFYVGTISKSDHIRIEIEKAYDSCRIDVITVFLNNMYIGKNNSIYQSIASDEMIHFFIGLVFTLIGTIVFFGSLLHNFKNYSRARQLSYIGLFCMLGGFSYVNDSAYEYIDLIFPYPVVNTLLDLICLPLLLLSYVMFITSTLTEPKIKRIMKWVTGIFAVIEAIPFFLQFSGYLDLHVIQDQFVLVGGVFLILTQFSIFYQLYHHKNRELQKIVTATTPIVVCLLFKVINVLLEHGIERSYLRIGILLSCLLLLHYAFQYVRRSIELAEKEHQMKAEMQRTQIAIMLSQIQPHFLYNSLNTLQHICLKDNKLAAEALEHFSRYLRGNMDSITQDHPIPFTQELEHVKHYLYIQKLRFGDRVNVEYDLEVTDFYIPTLTLQPIVENAVRHGITKKENGGLITIATRKVDDEIQIIVTDNGVGFTVNEQVNGYRSHIGINNVKKRLTLQCNGAISIQSSKLTGTKVIIRLKGMKQKDENHGR